MPEATQGVASVLTDGTGVSPITGKKLVKDFVYDFLTGAVAGFATAQITGVEDLVSNPLPVVFGIANAAIASLVRIGLRWSQS